MMKDAENRYQSCHGILFDLKTCWSIMQRRDDKRLHDHDVFTLGRRDFSERFQVSKSLYGRSDQIRKLLDLFDQARNGIVNVALISGASGSGKTALVNEIRRPIQMRGGMIVSGKFGQTTGNAMAYSALIDALHQIVRYILTESEGI
jgi:ABC-type glutathione transport system ATPase component